MGNLLIEKINGNYNEKIKALLEAISFGLSNACACGEALIHENTLYNYLKQAKEDEKNGIENSVYIEFAKDYMKARSQCMRFHLSNIRNGAVKGDWRASAFFLERSFPKDFGSNKVNLEEILEANSDNGVKIILNMRQIPKLINLDSLEEKHYHIGDFIPDNHKIYFENSPEDLYQYLDNGGDKTKIILFEELQELKRIKHKL